MHLLLPALLLMAAGSPLDRIAFLFGEWTANPATELGSAEGICSFAPDLDRHVVIRRNWVKYSSGTRHDDLLIVYPENSALRAIYFDNEGHTIRYSVTIFSANTAVFESEPGQPGPRYRLTHTIREKQMETRFDIALPGQSQYKTYVSGTSTKK